MVERSDKGAQAPGNHRFALHGYRPRYFYPEGGRPRTAFFL